MTIEEIEKQIARFMRSKKGQRCMVQSSKKTMEIIRRLDESAKVDEKLLDIPVDI